MTSLLLVLSLALVGLVCIAAAAFLVAVPLGMLVLGVESLGSAYVIQYLGVRR